MPVTPLPRLLSSTATPAGVSPPDGVTLLVYAPFGTDPVLTNYPGNEPQTIQQHPLVANLVEVAKKGVHVSALIDLFNDDSYLVEITALKPASLLITSRWKHQMQAINNLAGFIRYSRGKRPGTALVLALEGHGAGFLPEIDISQLTQQNLSREGSQQWRIADGVGEPLLPMGSPLLPMGSPLLPMGSPLLPVNHMPLSTWGLAQAIKQGLAPGQKLGVIHFNNCFNGSVELMHTVAPLADYATGYMNYNFFTGGEAYPAVFNQLKLAGQASTQELAGWFAEANRALLDQVVHHPTAGAVVQLSRMPAIASAIDILAKALIRALTTAPATERPKVVDKLRIAIGRAQQYDTVPTMKLDAPDELTDIASLAASLKTFDVNAAQVQPAAAALLVLLKGIKAYGASATPWPAPAIPWDFSSPDLALNILCPDPALRGLWDWRSPFYLQTTPDLTLPVPQPHVIDFLRNTAWVPFIIEYHKDVRFRGLLPAAIPDFPIFNRKHGIP